MPEQSLHERGFTHRLPLANHRISILRQPFSAIRFTDEMLENRYEPRACIHSSRPDLLSAVGTGPGHLHELLRHQRKSGQGWRPRRPGRSRRILQFFGDGEWFDGQDLRAYLSTDTENARDRIGNGPRYNAKGEKIADDVASLHSDNNNLTKQSALNEKGEVIPGRGDSPNRHDILTGSKPDGTAAPETCGNWTMGGAEGAAIVGHSDRTGLTILMRRNPELVAFDKRRLLERGIQGNRRRRSLLLLRKQLTATGLRNGCRSHR